MQDNILTLIKELRAMLYLQSKGGKGSGGWGHKGRSGQHGGSKTSSGGLWKIGASSDSSISERKKLAKKLSNVKARRRARKRRHELSVIRSKVGGKMTRERGQKIADALATRFGMPSTKVVESERKGTAAHVGSKDEIHINPGFINDPASLTSNAMAKNKKEIITHEYGHIVHTELTLNPNQAKHGLSGKASVREAVGISYNASLVSKMERIAKKWGPKLSEYASTNGEEYFAEAFTAYNRGPSQHNKIHPDVLKIFRGLDDKESS